jgi:hypothetical protein
MDLLPSECRNCIPITSASKNIIIKMLIDGYDINMFKITHYFWSDLELVTMFLDLKYEFNNSHIKILIEAYKEINMHGVLYFQSITEKDFINVVYEFTKYDISKIIPNKKKFLKQCICKNDNTHVIEMLADILQIEITDNIIAVIFLGNVTANFLIKHGWDKISMSKLLLVDRKMWSRYIKNGRSYSSNILIEKIAELNLELDDVNEFVDFFSIKPSLSMQRETLTRLFNIEFPAKQQ